MKTYLLYSIKFIVFHFGTICKKTFWIRLQCILVKSSTILTRSSTVAFCFIPLPSDIIICSAISAIFSRDKSKNVSMRSPSTNPYKSTCYFILDFIMFQKDCFEHKTSFLIKIYLPPSLRSFFHYKNFSIDRAQFFLQIWLRSIIVVENLLKTQRTLVVTASPFLKLMEY